MTADGMILPTSMELAEQEQQRAEQEKQRAEQERQRAEQAEGRLLTMARLMLAKGYTSKEVCELTGLSEAELVV